MNGVSGEKVDDLTEEERWRRYPAHPGNPEGTGEYLLQVGNGGLYLDAMKQNLGLTQGAGSLVQGPTIPSEKARYYGLSGLYYITY